MKGIKVARFVAFVIVSGGLILLAKGCWNAPYTPPQAPQVEDTLELHMDQDTQYAGFGNNEALWRLIPMRAKDSSSIAEWRGKVVARRPKDSAWRVFNRPALDSILAEIKKHGALELLKGRGSL